MTEPAPAIEKSDASTAEPLRAPGPVLVPPPAPPSSLRRLFANASIYGIGSFAVSAIGLILDPVLSYRLTRADFGLLGLCTSIAGMLTALYTAGLDSAANRSWFEVEHDESARRRVIGTSLTFLLAWILLLTVAQEIAGPAVYERLFDGLPYHPYGRLVALGLLLSALTAIPRALWAAREDVKRLVGLRVAAQLAGSAVLVGLLWWTDAGPLSVLVAEVVAPALLLWPFLRFARRDFGFAWDSEALRTSLAFGLPMVVHLTSHWALNAADRLVIDHMLGRDAVGLYSVAYKSSISVLITVNLSINGAYVPQFMRAQGKPEQVDFVARAVTAFVAASAGAVLAIVALGPTVLRAVYSSRFTDAAPLVPILSIGALLQSLYLISVNGLFQARRTRLLPVLTLLSGLANVAFCWWWIPSWGLVGAAWATTASYAVLAVLVWLACRTVTPIPWQTGRLVRLMLVLAVASIASWLVDGRLALAAEVAAKLGILLAAPLALAASGFFTAQEHQWFRDHVLARLRLKSSEKP